MLGSLLTLLITTLPDGALRSITFWLMGSFASAEWPQAWLLLLANVFWAVAYDTEYAMVDRDDDLKIGIKTSAITFGRYDVAAVMACYALTLGLIAWVGFRVGLGAVFCAGIGVSAGIAVYHYTLIRDREPARCFKAFLHNNWIGASIFAGIVLDYALRGRLG